MKTTTKTLNLSQAMISFLHYLASSKNGAVESHAYKSNGPDRTAAALAKRGLVQVTETERFQFVYLLTSEGRAALEAIKFEAKKIPAYCFPEFWTEPMLLEYSNAVATMKGDQIGIEAAIASQMDGYYNEIIEQQAAFVRYQGGQEAWTALWEQAEARDAEAAVAAETPSTPEETPALSYTATYWNAEGECLDFELIPAASLRGALVLSSESPLAKEAARVEVKPTIPGLVDFLGTPATPAPAATPPRTSWRFPLPAKAAAPKAEAYLAFVEATPETLAPANVLSYKVPTLPRGLSTPMIDALFRVEAAGQMVFLADYLDTGTRGLLLRGLVTSKVVPCPLSANFHTYVKINHHGREVAAAIRALSEERYKAKGV